MLAETKKRLAATTKAESEGRAEKEFFNKIAGFRNLEKRPANAGLDELIGHVSDAVSTITRVVTTSKHLQRTYIKYLKLAASTITDAIKVLYVKAPSNMGDVPSSAPASDPDPKVQKELGSLK